MECEIPLINDLTKTFNNFNVDEHFDSEIIQMHKNFINDNFQNYTNEQIYNYIKFINITCSDVKHYKHIVKYITKDNFNHFIELFDNYDICVEIFHQLHYDIVSCHPEFNNSKYYFKELWLEKNFDKLDIYYDDFEPYLIYNFSCGEYYLINNKILTTTKLDNIIYTINYIFTNNIKNEHIVMIVKYIINVVYEKSVLHIGDFIKFLIYSINKSIVNCNYDAIKYLIEYKYNYMKLYFSNFRLVDNNVKFSLKIDKYFNKIPIIEYPLFNKKYENILYYVDKNKFNDSNIKGNFFSNHNIVISLEHLKNTIINNRIDIIEYIIKNTKTNINDLLFLSVKYNNLEILEYLLKEGANINYENLGVYKQTTIPSGNLLMISSKNNNFEITKYLIDNGINIDIFGYDAIKLCGDLDIIKYIIKNFKDVNYNKLYNNVFIENNDVAKYLEQYYEFDKTLTI